MTTIIKLVFFIAIISTLLTSVKTGGECEGRTYSTSCPLPLPRDCTEIDRNECRSDGIYAIDPGHGKPMYVFCSMYHGTVILRRKFGGSENFNRSWEDYVNGFGDLEGEFWLGLDKMRQLTSDSVNPYRSLWVGVFTENGLESVDYSSFSVGSRETNYTLTIGCLDNNYRKNAINYLNLQRGMQFSTYDRDNDQEKSENCAHRHGAWWHDTCTSLNDNIQYLGEQLPITSGSTNLRVVEMSIR